jgi:hypothetical protein
MTTLWDEATFDHEAMARQAAFDRVAAELRAVMPFLLAARNEGEYSHRRALAGQRLETIALLHGLEPGEVTAMADRQYQLYRQALAEDTDPLDEVVESTHYRGSGPERADRHDEGPDFGPGYSEVPRGNLTRPDDATIHPGPGDPPQQWFQPVTREEAPSHPPSLMAEEEPRTAAKRRKKQLKAMKKQARLLREAQGVTTPDYMAETPPDLGTGAGSQDIGVAGPAGPPSVGAGSNNMSAGTGSTVPLTPPSIGQVTSSRDPVHAQVIAITASVRASNPWLPEGECRRIARQTVARYMPRTGATNWAPTAYDDSPPTQNGGGSGGDGGGGGAVQHMLEGQGLRSMLPGGAGAGAGGAGAAADVAELAAL